MHPARIYQIPETDFTVHQYASLASTNTRLKEQGDEFKPWTVLRAVDQSGGRGRQNRHWHCIAHEDLAFSMLLPLNNLPVDRRPNITQAAACGIARSIARFGLQPLIKWPNDLLIQNRKICGILTETTRCGALDMAVLGIGINVNSTAIHLAAIDRPATSLFIETGDRFDLDTLLADICIAVRETLTLLSEGGFPAIAAEYKARLDTDPVLRTFIDGNRTVQGCIRDLNDDGSLSVETPDGSMVNIRSGEIL